MITISGDQFVESGEVRSYIVSGIPIGFTFYLIELPEGWSVNTTGPIISNTQTFDLNTGIGSGTIVITYEGVSSQDLKSTYLDVYSSATRMGEEIKQDGCKMIPSISPVIPVAFCDDDSDCVSSLLVFADPDDTTNLLNNDKSEFYFYGNASVVSIDMILQKFENGSFSDVDAIANNSYGRFFPFGQAPDFSGNTFTDDYGKKYTGVLINWIDVYSAFGAGRYRMKVTQINIFALENTFYSQSEYCLKKWNCHIMNGTIRIETLNQGFRGSLSDMANQIDYSSGWNGQIRLLGSFKQLDPSYNKEYNQYGDADKNAYKPYIDEQVPKYKLQIKSAPGWLDWYISTNVLQADSILVTDFNKKSRHSFIRVPVKDGVFRLVNEEYKLPFAVIEVEFSFGQNNLHRRNS